jgi:phage-related protein
MRPLVWIGSCLEDLRSFPESVRRIAGYALYLAQSGAKHPDAKPLRGFRGAGVLEVSIGAENTTYRVAYTVKFSSAIYVLHAFQKKAKRGIATPQRETDLIRTRLRQAESLAQGGSSKT